jgi:uncharacterized protein YegJ (DUF2314 family)
MMTPLRIPRVLFLATTLLACAGVVGACAQPGKKAQSSGSDAVPIVRVATDDEAMNHAIDRARATSGELLARLRNPPRTQSYLGVKVRVGGADGAEHIWLYDVRLEGEQIVGRLLDDAEYYPNVHRGDEVRVSPSQISDWMTIDGGRACGGFTVRVMLPMMSEAERADYFSSMKISRFPDGDRVCDDEG